jgi:hypothetical protein
MVAVIIMMTLGAKGVAMMMMMVVVVVKGEILIIETDKKRNYATN